MQEKAELWQNSGEICEPLSQQKARLLKRRKHGAPAPTHVSHGMASPIFVSSQISPHLPQNYSMCLPGYAAPLLLTCKTSPYSPSPTRVMPPRQGSLPILQPPHTGGAGGCRREFSPASGDPKFARDSPSTLRFLILKSLKVCSTFCRNTRYLPPASHHAALAEPFATEFASEPRRLLGAH